MIFKRMNKELYDILEVTKYNLNGKLDPESARYLEKQILERKLDGLHLDDETRKKVKDLKEKISDLCIKFSENCNEEATKLTFSATQLDGLNEEMLNSLPKVNKKEFRGKDESQLYIRLITLF
jgi:Zn-dependent oligopeptidase